MFYITQHDLFRILKQYWTIIYMNAKVLSFNLSN